MVATARLRRPTQPGERALVGHCYSLGPILGRAQMLDASAGR
jgi:hypothetical protein